MLSGDAKTFIRDRVVAEDRGFSTPCWVWTKFVNEKGYARTTIPGIGLARVHRAAYELWVGPIADGMTLDHLCRVKSCCNPAHLEPVSALENYRRALPFIPRQTHCKRGHELIQGKRNCVVCHRERQRNFHLRRKAAEVA